MLVEVLKNKLHCARLTGCVLEYEGSLAVDPELLDAVGMFPNEKVLVVNQNNGERLTTYLIRGEPGSREFCLNGAAARRAQPGDRIIVIAFAAMTLEEARTFVPAIAVLDPDNAIVAYKGPGQPQSKLIAAVGPAAER